MVLQVDAMNLMGIVNIGSPMLAINELSRELLWFCLRHKITTSVELVPREENAFADVISNILIPEDYMLSRGFSVCWTVDGDRTRWTYSHRMRITCVQISFLCTGAWGPRGSMLSAMNGREKIVGFIVHTIWSGKFGGRCGNKRGRLLC